MSEKAIETELELFARQVFGDKFVEVGGRPVIKDERRTVDYELRLTQPLVSELQEFKQKIRQNYKFKEDNILVYPDEDFTRIRFNTD